MDPKGQSLIKLLFNENETICVSKNQFSFHSIPLKDALDGPITLLSPNESVPISYCNSSELTLVAINPINGFRNDSNVTAFRTFLFEIDTGSIKEQIGYFKHLGIPLSAQIFSGNRSVHALVILDEDLDEKSYRYLYEWALNILTMCDHNCKNPSRSVRIPGAYREPDKKQRLIGIGNRVSHKDFMGWLNQYPHLRPKVRQKKVLTGAPDYEKLSKWARYMLKNGLDFKKGRSNTWYALAYDLALASYSEEQAIEILEQHFEPESDFKEKEWLTTIRSAFKKVSEG